MVYYDSNCIRFAENIFSISDIKFIKHMYVYFIGPLPISVYFEDIFLYLSNHNMAHHKQNAIVLITNKQ